LTLLNASRTRPKARGLVLTHYLLAASAAGFIFGFWRGDETLLWNGLRVDQWFDGVLFLVALLLAFAAGRTGRRREPGVLRAGRRIVQHA
jgi:hypothetical protein